MARMNCWEILGCGHEHGCPAASDDAVHGVNGGECAGRLCWTVPDTLCSGAPDGTAEEKQRLCGDCVVYRRVAAEEGISLQPVRAEHSQAW